MEIRKRFKDYIQKVRKNQFVSKLLKNSFISFIGEGGAGVVTFFATIILIRLIGSRDYGILAVAYSFVTIIDKLLNFQSWHAMITFGSEAKEKNDYGALERLIKVGSIIDFSTAVIGTVVSIATASFFGSLLNWNQQTVECIYILSFIILFNFTGTSIGIIRLLDKFKLFSTFRIITEIIRLVLIVVFCGILNMGLTGAALAYSLGYILGYIILFGLFINVLRESKKISLKRVIRADIREDWQKVFKFTFWASMSSAVDVPVQQFDIIFLSMLSYEIVAVFKVYKQIGQVLTKLTTPIKQAVMPLFSELITQGKYKKCYNYFNNMKTKSNLIMVPSVFALTIASMIFMHFSLDSIYIEYWYILLMYLLLRGFALSYAPIHPLFVALGQVKQNFILVLVANTAYLLIVWISISHIGIWAILLGLLVEYFIVIFIKQKIIRDIMLKGDMANGT